MTVPYEGILHDVNNDRSNKNYKNTHVNLIKIPGLLHFFYGACH